MGATFPLFHDALRLAALVSGPILAALLVVGLVVGALQAATQINDPAVGFVPRALTAAVACWLLGGWMLDRLATFFSTCVSSMAGC